MHGHIDVYRKQSIDCNMLSLERNFWTSISALLWDWPQSNVLTADVMVGVLDSQGFFCMGEEGGNLWDS